MPSTRGILGLVSVPRVGSTHGPIYRENFVELSFDTRHALAPLFFGLFDAGGHWLSLNRYSVGIANRCHYGPTFISDHDAVRQGKLPAKYLVGHNSTGLRNGGLAGRLSIRKIAAFLVEADHVVIQVEVEFRHALTP
jgi:hypothetical protein